MTINRSVALRVVASLVLAQRGLAAECISLEPVQPIKPIPIYSALCGKIVDQVGYSLADLPLELIRESGGIVAKTRTDSAAAFKFPPVPAGKYRIGSPGWIISLDTIEITGPDQQVCERLLTVKLFTSGSECAASRISTGSGIRLEIWPKFGSVGIDGVLMGDLWELPGRSGFWPLPPGPHHIVVQSPGYELLVLDVTIKEYEINTYSGSLTAVAPTR